MIKPAQLYSNELKQKFTEIAYDERFKFVHGCSYSDEYEPIKTSWASHEFVILDNDNNLIGYIKYNIKRDAYNVYGFQLINFSLKPSYIFSKDLYTIFTDIFIKYKFNKASFSCVIGNPIENSYNKFIKRYGGKVVGIHQLHVRLLDGLMYDFKDYEILRVDYLKKKYEDGGSNG